MKIWCFLNRNSANKWRESCALWSSFPVAYVTRIFLGKLLGCYQLTGQNPLVSMCFPADLLQEFLNPKFLDLFLEVQT
jgi:hypothetical protein